MKNIEDEWTLIGDKEEIDRAKKVVEWLEEREKSLSLWSRFISKLFKDSLQDENQ